MTADEKYCQCPASYSKSSAWKCINLTTNGTKINSHLTNLKSLVKISIETFVWSDKLCKVQPLEYYIDLHRMYMDTRTVV